jgi:hypothetical protein
MGALITMVREFAHMKTAAILMESAFKEHKEMIDGVQTFVHRGLEGAEEQFNTVMKDYSKVLAANNVLQDRINKLEERQKKPMAPDVTFN